MKPKLCHKGGGRLFSWNNSYTWFHRVAIALLSNLHHQNEADENKFKSIVLLKLNGGCVKNLYFQYIASMAISHENNSINDYTLHLQAV